MAAMLERVRLKLVFDGGIVDGKEVKSLKTIQQIKKTATAEGLYSAAQTIASVQKKPLLMAVKLDESVLSE